MPDYTPKGGDGASHRDGSPVTAIGGANMKAATDAFRAMVLAIDAADTDTAQAVWDDFKTQLDGNVSAHGAFVVAGVMYNAWFMRNAAGDPNPTGQPTTEIALHGMAIHKDTGEIWDAPVETFVIQAIEHAANWRWDYLHAMFKERRDQGGWEDFMHDVATALVAIFIGVGGIDATGWRI